MAGQQCGRILYDYEITPRIIQPALKETKEPRGQATTLPPSTIAGVMTFMHRVLRNNLAGSDGPLSCDCTMTHVEQLGINCLRLSNKGELLSQKPSSVHVAVVVAVVIAATRTASPVAEDTPGGEEDVS